MIFNSLTFLVFLAIIVTAYWLLPNRLRLYLVFLSSLTFYGFWRIEFIPVMMFSVILDYFIGIKLEKIEDQKIRKRFVLLSLLGNLGLLFYFKYLIFFSNTAIGIGNLLGLTLDPIALKIILPLGISFYTFQTISYTVDVYRRKISPEKDFILYASYVTFFPQLVAGPILRAGEVVHQLAHRANFEWENISTGLRRIFYGLFLKVILADNLAPFVDTGFSMSISEMSALDVWTLSFLFGFQIYFDFSAYSHIALGSAKLMGINFPENFNFPYLATSPRDFWKRWHISLSSWIRDYLYLPLAGVKLAQESSSGGGLEVAVTQDRKDKALFSSWAIMGLWHGANWTFVVWGLYHAICVYIYRIINTSKLISNINLNEIIAIALTLPIMMLGWIPFRADSVSDTFSMWIKVIDPSSYTFLGMRENAYLIAALILIGIFVTKFVTNFIKENIDMQGYLFKCLETLLYFIILPLVLIFLRPINQFIYFQF